MRLKSVLGVTWVLALINGAYLMAFGDPTLVYFINILAHLLLGVALIGLVAWSWKRAGWLLLTVFTVAAIAGLAVAFVGGTRNHQSLMLAHALAAFAATLVFAIVQDYRRLIVIPCLVAVMAVPLIHSSEKRQSVITNPELAPQSMDSEGGGKNGPFFPSSIQTTSGGHVATDFISDSKACAQCHPQVYAQWKASMHHLSSFNNPFYRRAIEYMQPITGIQATKWCGGCHDPAVLLNGMMDRPINEIADTPEGQSGMGCLSCHAVKQVRSTMGNGDVIIDDSKWPRFFSFLTRLDSKPHRHAFMQTFHTEQPAEFCSACHKVHLDIPVNSYRWIRGFDEYDNWQGSGVSGEGARSFYYPQSSQTCVGCHMPSTPSMDPAAKDGKIRSHFFPGANTGVPIAIHDKEHLAINEAFLKANKMRVDIFAASGVTTVKENQPVAPAASTMFASGEESEDKLPHYNNNPSEAEPVIAPLDKVAHAFKPGEDARIDVVVRTLGLGHFFPGGTVDAFDVWLELKATDDSGRVIFWSGEAADNGRGAVDPSAHFYRSMQIDGDGNPINKRNAWAARATMYVNLIPPGSADVAHYLLKIPKNSSGKIHLQANLNYRKFSAYYLHFAYETKPETPELPIITLASAATDLVIADAKSAATAAAPNSASQRDALRWNDYGIGLFRQGDFSGAVSAFQQVTQLDPQYVDGWVNVARVLVEEGETAEAQKWLDHALKLDSNLGRGHFYRGLALKAAGDYDGALREFQSVAAQYPRDRVNLNQIGRILFLKRQYADAVGWFKRTTAIDPEDVTAHYNLMLCYRGLNESELSAVEEKLYLRFKADESAQTITGEYRRNHPIDNNERQPIHLHEGSR